VPSELPLIDGYLSQKLLWGYLKKKKNPCIFLLQSVGFYFDSLCFLKINIKIKERQQNALVANFRQHQENPIKTYSKVYF
jgi:hypothetical protein